MGRQPKTSMKKILLFSLVALAASAPVLLIAELAGAPGIREPSIETVFAIFAGAGVILNAAADYAYRHRGHTTALRLAAQRVAVDPARTGAVGSLDTLCCGSSR